MSSSAVSPFRKAWYKWKALHLPWRKRFLIGMIPHHPASSSLPFQLLTLTGLDLQGNTFWEFRDTLSSHKYRMRRIVQYPPTVHYSDLNISPQWHQWLRHTRQDPPSLTEQSQDLVRQENLKALVAQADARWAAKPSFLDAPGKELGQALPATQIKDPGGYAPSTEPLEKQGVRSAVGGGLGDQVQGTDTTLGEPIVGKKEEEIKMQAPDGIRHHFVERPVERKKKDEDQKEDPWKKARGGPSEEWQPKAWSGNTAAKR
jgi:NADH dehydrogenase [ubiquinone] 1 alpha subcomplex assembly factor 2